MQEEYLELNGEFWKCRLEGSSFTIRYGRVGTNGQVLPMSFPSEKAARKAFDEHVNHRLQRGFQRRGEAIGAISGALAGQAVSAKVDEGNSESRSSSSRSPSKTGSNSSLSTAEKAALELLEERLSIYLKSKMDEEVTARSLEGGTSLLSTSDYSLSKQNRAKIPDGVGKAFDYWEKQFAEEGDPELHQVVLPDGGVFFLVWNNCNGQDTNSGYTEIFDSKGRFMAGSEVTSGRVNWQHDFEQWREEQDFVGDEDFSIDI